MSTNQGIASTSSQGDVTVVEVHGDVDFSRSPELRQDLLRALESGPTKLVVDLSGVGYMDSSGVATLIEALQAQHRAGRKMLLCGLQPRVRGIFEIARLTSVFTIAADRRSAME